jgi:hypothetical protein
LRTKTLSVSQHKKDITVTVKTSPHNGTYYQKFKTLSSPKTHKTICITLWYYLLYYTDVKFGQLETSAEMKFMRRTTKYTRQGSLKELKIHPVV